MLTKFRLEVLKFTSGTKDIPVISAISSGLYPLLYYYDSNFTLVNSWPQFIFFIGLFLILPIVVFYAVYFLCLKINFLKSFRKFIIPIMNFSYFSFLIVICTSGIKKGILGIVLLIAVLLGLVFYKYFKKIVVIQFLLAGIVFAKLVPDVYKHVTYSNSWMAQPDHIEQTTFKKKPNIYFIQPDGYANFSELKRGYYNFDNSKFEYFLKNNSFKLYDYRSNYVSTLSSNSSLFAMKHHYYNNTSVKAKELYNARQIIVGKNPVISILKNNNYKTFLILERSYLLVNRPEVYYDYCNINRNEISFLARGFEVHKDIMKDLSEVMDKNTSTNNFYFINKMDPSHVSVNKNESKGIEGERKVYLEALEQTNSWLKKTIDLINEKDKNSLIIIAADHGGYVGLNYSLENRIKQTNRDIIYSIFTSALAIKWPQEAPHYDSELKTPVNLFRVLFTYLSENENYLMSLQDNKSYSLIFEGAPFGVYEYIDEKGEKVFSRIKE